MAWNAGAGLVDEIFYGNCFQKYNNHKELVNFWNGILRVVLLY